MTEEILDVMPSEPKNFSMSVELAIQRELAYRKRVARLSELYGGSVDGLKPLELLSPNPNPCPSKKRPQGEAMTSSPHSQPKPSPTQASNASTQYQRWSLHLSGSKRKEPSSEEQEEQLIYSSNESAGKYLFCEICQVHCSGDLNMKQHLDGQKHKAKLLLAEISRESETKVYGTVKCVKYIARARSRSSCTSEARSTSLPSYIFEAKDADMPALRKFFTL